MHSIFKHEEALAQMSEIQIDCCFDHDCKLQFVLLKRVESCKNIPCPIVSSSLDSMKPESTCRMLTSPFLFGTNGKKYILKCLCSGPLALCESRSEQIPDRVYIKCQRKRCLFF